jgi:hypothetical protein
VAASVDEVEASKRPMCLLPNTCSYEHAGNTSRSAAKLKTRREHAARAPHFSANNRRHSPVHERATDSGQTMGMRFVRREISTLAARGFLREHLTLAHAYAMFLCNFRMQSVAQSHAQCASLESATAVDIETPYTRILSRPDQSRPFRSNLQLLNHRGLRPISHSE